MQDESARSAQIISGTVDVDPWAPLKLLDSFKAADGVELVGGPTSRYEYTAFQSHVRGVKHEAGHTRISLEETWLDT